ncbi:MAG: saccharopine dehydrogenase NADP-binding domain-containing protein [Bdellovibrio sp.]
MQNADCILIVGGYGEVGSLCVRTLLQWGYRIRLAGRSSAKASAFMQTLPEASSVSFCELDLRRSSSLWMEALAEVSCVILCVESPDTAFAEFCLQKGVLYLDITADDKTLQALEALHSTAQHGQSVALLSVGLAPGLTNLLVREATQSLPLAHVDIGVLLGLGDSHGEQALDWTLENLLFKDGFGSGKNIAYAPPWGVRRSYPFAFADQRALLRTTSLQSVRTYLCLSSSLLTRVMFFLRHPRIRPLAQRIKGFLKVLFGRPLGTQTGYALSVRARDGSSVSEIFLVGRQEALVTAVTAAACAEYLLSRKQEPGVYHIHQVLHLSDLSHRLEAFARIHLSRSSTR